MRLRGALLVVAVLACTPPSPAPSVSPARAVRAAPQTVILQAADVPADYAIEKDEAMSPDDLANGLGTTVAELKQRLAFGYVRRLSSSARERSSSARSRRISGRPSGTNPAPSCSSSRQPTLF